MDLRMQSQDTPDMQLSFNPILINKDYYTAYLLFWKYSDAAYYEY